MANKKISQLVGIGTSSTVSGTFLLPVGAGSSTGPYTTNKITTSQLASYIFTGDSGGGGFPATALSGQKDVYFNNPNWQDTTSAADGANYAYLMVKAANGLLTTGSGIARPVGGDNLGNHTATQTLDMSDEIISNVGQTVNFQDGGNIGSSTAEISLEHPTKIKFDAPTIQLGVSDNVTVDGSFSARSADFAGTITGDSLEVQGASYHNVTDINASASAGSINVDWTNGNIQHQDISANTTFTFTAGTPNPGQTLTMYVENTQANFNDFRTVLFKSGSSTDKVLWSQQNDSLPHAQGTAVSSAGAGKCPGVSGARTNVYTFIVMHEKIFASAVTGYNY
jgi:hypothetical protein